MSVERSGDGNLSSAACAGALGLGRQSAGRITPTVDVGLSVLGGSEAGLFFARAACEGPGLQAGHGICRVLVSERGVAVTE